jgi:hypothetical protein
MYFRFLDFGEVGSCVVISKVLLFETTIFTIVGTMVGLKSAYILSLWLFFLLLGEAARRLCNLGGRWSKVVLLISLFFPLLTSQEKF